jgi:AAA domain-containing protein
VVVSGPPGSGKTSLATALAQEMGLPLLAKDQIKETLMSVLVVPDVDASKLIGLAAIEVMYAVAGASSIGAILEANFHRSASVAGLQGLPGSVVEVFCRCDREIALARYRERSEHRHPGHFDLQRTDDELWNDEVTAPVAGGWAVLETDTTRPVSISAVVLDIRRALGSS